MPELILQRTRHQAQGYTEPLGDLGLDMMLIPAGEFLMGSPADEPERRDSEGPQHRVSIPSFFLGRFPVTQAQWRFVAELPQQEIELKRDPAKFKGGDRPVEQVNWHEAVEFCARLAEHTQRPYRLPSEAEWEYACRAGTTTPFHFGETISSELANYDGNYAFADGPKGKYREKTTPVGSFQVANDFGLCDMHGNILEWCQDVWHDNYEGAPTDGSAWTEGGNQGGRILRGGSCFVFPWFCRSAYRYNITPGDRSNGLGFRVCCTAPQKQATAPGFS
ncbi:formylglycine-generating enzyme family protein [Halomicronema sp. CCY15110]|uniref:formylglycine-generating enzyme family protein n=1 Tax=Halomicronema sp. CCY15110 TaxID=2767773 RepID=UPI00194E1C6B|nr:formylglycine-generating enzyme family protein [Halomicronema sp. CCY15110]